MSDELNQVKVHKDQGVHILQDFVSRLKDGDLITVKISEAQTVPGIGELEPVLLVRLLNEDGKEKEDTTCILPVLRKAVVKSGAV